MKDPWQQQRTAVVDLSQDLLRTGLVVRTWGNVSHRTEGNAFVVTPSGRQYETMIESDLAVIDEEGKPTGPFKPSSEFPMHKLCYELRPQAQAVAHTHQPYASALSLVGESIPLTESEAAEIGQSHIYTAKYALPSTSKLHASAKRTLEAHPDAHVILLEMHGAFLCGATPERALELALAVERAGKRVYREITGSDLAPREVPAGEVARSVLRDRSALDIVFYDADSNQLASPPAETVRLHEDMYKARKDVSAIERCEDSEVARIAQQVMNGQVLRPYLDDFAQLVGIKADTSYRKNNVAFVDGVAWCLGKDAADAEAVGIVLRKNARAALVAQAVGASPIVEWECRLMNFIYKVKYSKQAG